MKKLSIQHLFNASNQELFGHIRRKELRMLVKLLENAATKGGVVDISEKVHGLLEDVVYKIILGRNNDDQFDLKGLVSEVLTLAGAFNLADIVPCLEAFDLQGLRRQCKEISKALDQLFEKFIKEHEQARKTQKDGKNEDFIDILLSLMHQPMDDEQTHQITRDDIKANTLSLISAAYETSAISVEWTLAELLRNPRVMKNLQDELETVVGVNRMVEEMDLSELNYLNLVMKENFRLHPVTPFIPRASAKDVMVGEYYIEKKSRILVNLWALGRNPQIWSDNADVFYPERFLNNNIDLQGHDFQFLPFGSGRRKCLGMQLGQTTVKLVVAQLVQCFNWELPPGMKPDDLDMTESFGFSLPRSKHLLVELTRRLSSGVSNCYCSSVPEVMRLGGVYNLADFVLTLGAFDLQGITRQLKETSEAIDGVLEKILKEYEQAFNERRGKQNDDLVDILLSPTHQPLNDDEQNFVITRHNIKGTALEIIFASFETTASTIDWALSELLRDPKVMKKLQVELETVVGMDRMVEEADISKLNSLDMVVKETLRLFPVGIFIPPSKINTRYYG
ncbi:cytochrome P450 CYP736A12-like [Neltuma alba]|uniref:cytochrome P450 CYP736A12-like n=1 Tax=Neltuma alba TaxID=207710 RepID=UPI0010A336DB|nr:cytochrome P450 CYP736A12-like [Prosopis alba]